MLCGKQFPRAAAAELLLARFPPPFPLLRPVLFLLFFLSVLFLLPVFAAAFDMRADIADVRFMLFADLITSYPNGDGISPRVFFFFFFFSPCVASNEDDPPSLIAV